MGNSNAKIVHSEEESVSISSSQEVAARISVDIVPLGEEQFQLLPQEIGSLIFSYFTKVALSYRHIC
jgi:hypothetical protein